MTMTVHGGGARLPYAERVRVVAADQPYLWLRAGWRDFRHAMTGSLAYGLIFVILGFALTVGLWRAARIDLLLPLASGFIILVPLLALGLHQISREIDRPGRPSFLKNNAGAIMNAALALLFVFLLWIRLCEIAFALAFPPNAAIDAAAMAKAAFGTVGGIEFVALFLAFGAALATLTFMGGAFSLPMLLDRDAGMAEAIATSFTACRMNPRTMTIWAALMFGLVTAGLAFAYIGLAVALPVAGHASWHAYRAVIAR
jgi:uncharacterized membrane protein